MTKIIDAARAAEHRFGSHVRNLGPVESMTVVGWFTMARDGWVGSLWHVSDGPNNSLGVGSCVLNVLLIAL